MLWLMEMPPQLVHDSELPLYRQLYEQLAGQIRSGKLVRGDRLPATRELAGLLGLNRTTISAAYELLEADGLIAGQVGRGSFVTRGAQNSVMESTGQRFWNGPNPCRPDRRPDIPLLASALSCRGLHANSSRWTSFALVVKQCWRGRILRIFCNWDLPQVTSLCGVTFSKKPANRVWRDRATISLLLTA